MARDEEPRRISRPIAALTAVVATLAVGLSACGGDDEPQTATEPTAEGSPTATPTEEALPAPAVFDALNCDRAMQDGDVWTCHKGTAPPPVFFMSADPATVVPEVTSSKKYNPNGDVFFETPEGVLYLPGDQEWFDASMTLADPNDPYDAGVVDTDQYR
jgi:hypothetical protein